jgi:eukaryotic-like serine/threonine-protein kinase
VAKGLDPALIGSTIAGKFTIESYIGAGAMGAVYRARQTALDKAIAVKVLHRELTTEEAFTARFKREAKAASHLDHPNSVRVIDFGVESDGIMYIAMDLLDGRDLLRVLADDWPLSSARIADIVMQALAALSVAHDMGVVHRDLKPENIMILAGSNDEGQPTDIVKVCDFGIAKLTERRDEKLSQGGGPLTVKGSSSARRSTCRPSKAEGTRSTCEATFIRSASSFFSS